MDKSWYKWEVLGLLWIAFFLNQADRQIYNTLIGDISAALSMTPAQAGLVATLFSFTMAVCLPIFGFAADKFSKKKIIIFAVILWSSATIFSGACTGFLSFVIFRSVATGAGEGAFGPANYSTIADYHKESRAMAMSIHQTSYYLGVIVSGVMAAWIASVWGWQSTFYVFGSLGVLLAAILVWRLKDKKPEKVNVVQQSSINLEKPSIAEAIKIFFSTPSAICLTLAYAGVIFVLQAYLTWSTLFLQEKFSIGIVEAGFSSVFYTHIAAFVGILIAGKLSDKFAFKRVSYRALLQSAGMFLAAPFLVLIGLSAEIVVVYAGFLGFGFFRAFFDANTYAVLYDIVPERYRASSTAIKTFIGWSIGSFAPFLMGVIKPHLGLSYGIASLSLVWLVCGLSLFSMYKFFYMRDYNIARLYDSKHSI